MSTFRSGTFTRTNGYKRPRVGKLLARAAVPLVVLFFLLPATTLAQVTEDQPASTTKGVYFEGLVSGGTMSFGDFDGVDAGATFSGRLGYGITNSIGLFAGFQAGRFASNSDFTGTVHSPDDAYVLGSFDLGAQYNVRSGREWVPYAELSYTRLITGDGFSNTFSANGLTLGAGMRYYVTETWALNGRVQASPVNVYSLDYNGQELDNQEWSGLSTRLSVGLTWFPFR